MNIHTIKTFFTCTAWFWKKKSN